MSQHHNKNCILFARTASDFQDGRLEKQIGILSAYAARHNLTVVDTVSFVDSGLRKDRRIKKIIRRKIEQDDFDCLLVASSDRLSRNFTNSVRLIDLLNAAKIEVIDISGDAIGFPSILAQLKIQTAAQFRNVRLRFRGDLNGGANHE